MTPLKKACSEARPRADFRTRGRVRELFFSGLCDVLNKIPHKTRIVKPGATAIARQSTFWYNQVGLLKTA